MRTFLLLAAIVVAAHANEPEERPRPEDDILRVLADPANRGNFEVAVMGVSGIEDPSPRVLPALLKALDHFDDANALGRLGRAIVHVARGPDVDQGVAELARDEHVLLRLTAAIVVLHSTPPDRRAKAGRTVAGLLHQALKDPEADVRHSGIGLAFTVRFERASLVPHLTQALSDPEWIARHNAAEILGRWGPIAGGSVGTLKALAGQPAGVPVPMAARTAWRITGDADWPVARLVNFLKAPAAESRDPEGRVLKQEFACVVLAEIGSDARAAVPALVDALSRERVVSAQVARALGKIGVFPPRAVGRLVAMLRDEVDYAFRLNRRIEGFYHPPDPRVEAAYALAIAGKPERRVIGALTEAAREDDCLLRVAAHYALAKLGVDKRRAVAALTRLSRSDYLLAKCQALAALERLRSGDAGAD